MKISHSTPTTALEHFVEDGQWRIEDIRVKLGSDYYEDTDETYSNVEYYIKLHRKPLFHVSNMVAPCVFLTLCGMLVFLLPPDSGEKVSLSVTMLLSSTVFLLVIADSMPVQSDVIPHIGK